MYPLRFAPTFRDYLWGGRRLADVLGKELPDGPRWAESWEVVDHGADQSVVVNGEWAGKTLGELTQSHGEALLGADSPQDRFPLLFKFLDCCRNLSLQVHPDDAGAAKLTPPDRGKTEAWVVLDAAPGATLWAGLRQGATRENIQSAIERDELLTWMHPIQPEAGDCVFVPAGAPHALGEGMLVAEIQQASNTTFRLYDWGRVGPDGNPRALHIEAGLDAIDYELGPLSTTQPIQESPDCELLADCDKFQLRRLTGGTRRELGRAQHFEIIAVLRGDALVRHAGGAETLNKGDTLLNPASCVSEIELGDSAVVLLMQTGA